jgi:hypothetical protein
MRTRLALTIHRRLPMLALAVAVAGLAPAQPQTSLQGRELQLTSEGGSGLESLLGGLLGGQAPGRIDRIVVLEEGPGHVSVALAQTGLAGARITAEIRDRRRDRIALIAPVTVQVPPDESEVRLAFELRPQAADAGEIESGYLRLSIAFPSRPLPVTMSYMLPKTWSSAGSEPKAPPVVTIAPAPVGAAAKLGARPDYENAPRPPVRPRPGVLVAPTRPVGTATAPGGVTVTPGATRRTAEAAKPAPAGAAPPPPATPPPSQRAGAQTNKTVIARTATAQATLPPQKSVTLLGMQAFQFGIRDEDRKLGAQGPGEGAIDLLEGLAADDVGLTGDEVLMVAPIVYQDQNPASGIFYFIPRGYRTEWTPETGYGLRMLYGAAKGTEAGEVAIAARFDAGVDLRESRLAAELLQAYVKRHPHVKYTALRPLPIEQVSVSLAGGLQQYSIPPERIATVAISDILGQIEISCVTDAISKESLQLALTEDIGLSGAVTFTPSGGRLAPQQVPLRLRLAGTDSFGTLTWQRDRALQNHTLYPLTLTYLHALILDPRTHTPIVYSWDLGRTQVAPGGRVEWDASRVPAWVERDARRMWVQYRPMANCRTCDEQVIAEVTGGVVSVSTSQLVFRTITPLEDTGAYELTVHVRSRHFDPQGQQTQQKSLVVNADGEDFPIGPLYVGDSTPGTIAEYAIDVVMRDGTVHKAKRWLRIEGLRVIIGTAQIRESTGIGTLPAGGGTP